MEQSVTTRLGDGSLVRMTPSEIRADLEEATALGAKKAKTAPLPPDELDQLLEIFASNAKFSAVDVGDELVLSCDGSGNFDSGTGSTSSTATRATAAPTSSSSTTSTTPTRRSRRSSRSRPRAMKSAQLNLVAPLQYGAMPDLGRYSRPDGPGGQLVRAHAAGPHRRRASGPGRGRGTCRTRHGLRRRGHDRGRRRRSRLRHRRRRRRRRPSGRPASRRRDQEQTPRHRHRARHGERVRARHARRARVPRPAPCRAVAARPGQGRRRGRRDHVRAGRQRQHHQVGGLERGPCPDHRQALRRRGRQSPST